MNTGTGMHIHTYIQTIYFMGLTTFTCTKYSGFCPYSEKDNIPPNENEYSSNIPVYMQRVFRVSLCSTGNGNHKISAGSEVNQRGETHLVSCCLIFISDIDMTDIINL